jgi:hypothetical protein
MTSGLRIAAALIVLCTVAAAGEAQDLTPRAYLSAPVSSNAIVVTYAFADGELVFDPTVPIEDAKGQIHAPVLTYFHTFNLLGRSANVMGSLPFAFGVFSGAVNGQDRWVHRNGSADIAMRIAVNLLGGAALTAPQFLTTPRPRATLGTSLKILAPTGQYDPALLINIGANRWAFKPELGYTQRAGPLTFDAYAGVWFFTTNDAFFAGSSGAAPRKRSQDPITAFEAHVSYDFKPRLWISFDMNYWRGGATSIDGVTERRTLQANSRIGITGSLPLTRRQSVKISVSDGIVVRIGGKYRIFSVGWQYGWVGWPLSTS